MTTIPVTYVPARAPSRPAALAVLRCLPCGALWALLFAVAFHLVVAGYVRPEPVARRDLRAKMMQLTTNARPRLIFAGDSRVMCGVNPIVAAAVLGIPPDDTVNIALGAGSTASIRAAWREFADRFAARPVMVLGVSAFDINEHAGADMISNEFLWSLPLAERMRYVSVARVIESLVLPEKSLLAGTPLPPATGTLFRPVPAPVSGRGFRSEGVPANRTIADMSAEHLEWQGELLHQTWYADAEFDGPRWQSLAADLSHLASSGVQIVMVVTPYHPSFMGHRVTSPVCAAEATFQAKLEALCEHEGIPCLRYDASCLGEGDVDAMFSDTVHLSADGATRFSRVLAGDLAEMLAAGDLELSR